MATFSSVLDLAHKLFDHYAADKDASAEPAPQPSSSKNPGLHPGEGSQIEKLELMKDPNDPRK